jgi:hypothetical protein
MKLFKKDKPKIEWTEKTAPKNLPIDVEVIIKVKVQNGETYSSENKYLATLSSTEMLVAKTDSDRTAILDQIEEKVAAAFEKVEVLVLANENYLTDGYWEEVKKEKEKVN